MAEARALSQQLKKSLSEGDLKPLLDRVRKDHTLDLQFRGSRLHVYYRGGRISEVISTGESAPRLCLEFDQNYLCPDIPSSLACRSLPRELHSEKEVQEWLTTLPYMKEHMDRFLAEKVEKNEREFQQLLVRDNNYTSTSNSTDYFIIDTEYQNRDLGRGQADLIAMKWAKNDRKGAQRVRLSLVEVKFGDAALDGTSGIVEHVQKMLDLARSEQALQQLKQDMLFVFQQKRDMGLVRFGNSNNQNQVQAFSDEAPEILLVLMNHNPASTKLMTELGKIPEADRKLLSFACSSFMGYGLYSESVYSYAEFVKKCSHLLRGRPEVATR